MCPYIHTFTGILHSEKEADTHNLSTRIPPRKHGLILVGLPEVH